MEINKYGNNLNILISCDHSLHHDWMSFALWYSIYKNLPDVTNIAILCARDLKNDYASFVWPHRCDVKFFQHENVGKKFGYLPLNKLYATYLALKEGLVEQPLLVLDYDLMCLNTLGKELLDLLNKDLKFGSNDAVWYFNDQNLEKFVESLNCYKTVSENSKENTNVNNILLNRAFGESEFLFGLCNRPQDKNSATFCHYNNPVGQFNKKQWLERNVPPFAFSEKLSLLDSTVNEKKILKAWSKMNDVYLYVR